MQRWAGAFTAQHPGTPARVTLASKFSAEAFDALLAGNVAVAPFARELFPAERARYLAQYGTEPRLVPVATGSRDTRGGTHAIAIFVNARNPLARLSLDQLREILARDGSITTWGQLGLDGVWAQKKINLHGMSVRRETGNPPGIVNFIEQRVLSGLSWRDEMTAHVDSPVGPQALEHITRAVAADEYALGYSGFGYVVPGTRTLDLAETAAGPFYAGTPAEIARRDYPLSRTIYLCIHRAADELAVDFVRHVLTPEGQSSIANDARKFFPLPARVLATAQASLR